MAESEIIARIAYDASLRALASQEEALSGLHARASFLLAAAGIATGTVLGRTGGQLNRAGLIAIAFFAATAIIATSILAPRSLTWRFTTSAVVVLDASASYPALGTEEAVLRWLGRVNERNYVDNRDKLKRQYAALAYGCGALVAAILAAVVSLAS